MEQDRFNVWLHDLARQMARSGRYCSWRMIQIELRFMQGIREAADGFAGTDIRTELDALCRNAQRPAGSSGGPALDSAA